VEAANGQKQEQETAGDRHSVDLFGGGVGALVKWQCNDNSLYEENAKGNSLKITTANLDSESTQSQLSSADTSAGV
jgi:hypothetical protein